MLNEYYAILQVTATALRHLASTLYAALDVPEKDRKLFYLHMGHSREINERVYQCPNAIGELTVVAKHLAAFEDRFRKSMLIHLHYSSTSCDQAYCVIYVCTVIIVTVSLASFNLLIDRDEMV